MHVYENRQEHDNKLNVMMVYITLMHNAWWRNRARSPACHRPVCEERVESNRMFERCTYMLKLVIRLLQLLERVYMRNCVDRADMHNHLN